MKYIEEKRLKLVRGKYYLYRTTQPVKVVSFNQKENRVVLYRFDTGSREHIEYDTASLYLTPLFKIGDLARMLQRQQDTIRKYEKSGLIAPPQIFLNNGGGKARMRLYNEQEVRDISLFFSLRPAAGRKKKTNSKIDQRYVNAGIKMRYKENFKK